MNNYYFSAIHYDIHLGMKLGYTISRIFPEISLSELETPHHLCELERTQILQSLALAVLKTPYARYLSNQALDQSSLSTKETYYGITHVLKISLFYDFEDKRCFKRIPIFYKNEVQFVDTLSRRK